MSEIEKIQRYIDRTKMDKSRRYQMNITEMFELADAALVTPVDIICVAFDYGRAKGYRAAKAEVRA